MVLVTLKLALWKSSSGEHCNGWELQSRVKSRSLLTTTPPSNMHPTIVVPVLVAFGNGTPLACNAALRVWFEKSKPGMLTGWRELESSCFDGSLDDYGEVWCSESGFQDKFVLKVWFRLVERLKCSLRTAVASANATLSF